MCRTVLFTALLLFASLPASADVGLAKALFESRDPKAPALIAQLLKTSPDHIEVRVLYIRQLLRDGKTEDAVDLAEELVEDHENSALASYWLGNAYGNRIGQVGMLGKLSIAPKMRDAFETTIKLDPDHLDARINLIPFYLQAPAAIGGGIDKAKAQVAEIAKRDVARGHEARAQVLMSEGKPDEALKSYETAFALKPGEARYRSMLGVAYQNAKQWDKAFAHYEKWTAEDPNAAAAWYQLGRASVLSGQKVEAGVAALRHYLKLPIQPGQPEIKHAWYRLGQALVLAGRKEEGRAAFQSALKLDPKLKEAKDELAKLGGG